MTTTHRSNVPGPAKDRAEAALPADFDPSRESIVFFDGVCGLCNRTVDFFITRDRHRRLRFTPLQGETAAQLLPEKQVADLDTVVYWVEGTCYSRSTAIVRMLRRLGGLWGVAGWLLWLVPAPLRDLGYRAVSKCRYRLFGKKESCRLPGPGEQERFLL